MSILTELLQLLYSLNRDRKRLITVLQSFMFRLRIFTQLAVLKLLQFRFLVKIKAVFAKLKTDCGYCTNNS